MDSLTRLPMPTPDTTPSPSIATASKATNFRYRSKSVSGSTVILDSETGAELRRHEDLWFEDGSVICQAETTIFRVHMSQLARHSALFRDLFSLPQPAPSDLSIQLRSQGQLSDCEDCPLVYLHDRAEDVGNLLTALYDGPYVPSSPPRIA